MSKENNIYKLLLDGPKTEEQLFGVTYSSNSVDQIAFRFRQRFGPESLERREGFWSLSGSKDAIFHSYLIHSYARKSYITILLFVLVFSFVLGYILGVPANLDECLSLFNE